MSNILLQYHTMQVASRIHNCKDGDRCGHITVRHLTFNIVIMY